MAKAHNLIDYVALARQSSKSPARPPLYLSCLRQENGLVEPSTRIKRLAPSADDAPGRCSERQRDKLARVTRRGRSIEMLRDSCKAHTGGTDALQLSLLKSRPGRCIEMQREMPCLMYDHDTADDVSGAAGHSR